MQFRKTAYVLATATAFFCVEFDADAANKTWIAGSGNWSVNPNWTPFGRPADFDNVFLTSTDTSNRVVTYDVNDGFLHLYGNILVQTQSFVSMELHQPGTDLEATTLSVSSMNNNGAGRHRITGGGSAYIGHMTVGARGFLDVGGGSRFQATNVSQFGGSITIDPTATFSFSGTYMFNNGTVSGAVRVPNSGTLLANGGTFGASVENFGALIINADMNFTEGVTNHSPFTVPASRSMQAHIFDQRGATVAQHGNAGTIFHTVHGGATWSQSGGMFNSYQSLIGGSEGNGTYVISSGSFSSDRLHIGSASAGTFIQNGGNVLGHTLLHIGGTGSLGSARGHYRLTGGTLQTLGQFIVGTENSQGGTFEQTGGYSEFFTFVVNANSTTSGTIQLSGGTHVANNTSLNNGTFNQTGGSARINESLDGAGHLSVTGTGSFTAERIRQRSVFVGGNGRILQNASFFTPTHRVSSLTFEEAGAGAIRGTWDLGQTDLAIDYTGSSPVNDIKRYISSGYASGNWNGTGLRSAAAAAFNRALGYAEASDVLGPSGGVFSGVPVDGTTILVKFTLYGDANLDGTINLLDFNRLAANFGQSNGTWFGGDFNYDGLVNLSDFNALAANFGLSATGPDVTPDDWATLASAVPEPAGVLFAVGLTGLAALLRPSPRRRRRASPSSPLSLCEEVSLRKQKVSA